MNYFKSATFLGILFFLTSLGAFAEEPLRSPSPSNNHASLDSLTLPERQEYQIACQKALMDPAVQSTREIARMDLHKAILKVNPSLDTIFANMDAYGPEGASQISEKKKNLGDIFPEWLANYPAASTQKLTPENLHDLEAAHKKALEDPAVKDAIKIARLTFYNALINADPVIEPILSKAGIATPKSVQSLSKNSKLGSEEKILGGDVQAWGEEVLAPAIPTPTVKESK